ncbi:MULTISPECIES: HigA family addiction module antitoxin [Nostoc]|jgi:addiction module HigA family antidote|uniref:Virulence-associated protein n=2 Tax=Nostoc TaxID=1177 RepID=A0A2R5FU87_NOSCO|nr:MULTISPECIES: HigA family addiction module antitoxin [Nostoc]MCC5604061.1 HigA family addiction module antidote protein [Nostoc favosum CHAB5714]MCC5641554.1 HigA family addiction module antidote protein [Nostoc sp. CHAB 5824]BBD69764.1 virulence-associated protein [Nostoc commune HK-02]GBG19234.1 virulence-associated protein [Nostoc commune NIES-4072]
MRVPKYRPPSHPGEILLKDFLDPMGITQRELADALHVPYQRINELVNQKRGITPSTAIRLSKFFGNSSEFWLNLQQNWELYHVLKEEEEELKSILQFRTTK